LAITQSQAWYGLPGWALADPAWLLRMGAASLSVALFAATVVCWYAMGKAWSVAVLPGEHQTLLTRGPFAIVRHPIYSLSIQLMLCTLVTVPNWPMAVVAATHIALMVIKVGIEEQALAEQFGARWMQYTRQTGRLWPRWWSAEAAPIERQAPPPPRFQAGPRVTTERVDH
jgi:protein-S-isoprenylcysteine O-methyltransferase Ste14